MTLTVTLPDDLAEFIRHKVASGRYRDAEDVIHDALVRLDETAGPDPTDEASLAWLRQAWQEGIASGDAGELTAGELKRRVQELRAQRR